MLYFEARPRWNCACGAGICVEHVHPYFGVNKGELSLNGIFDRPTAFVLMSESGRARSELSMKKAASSE